MNVVTGKLKKNAFRISKVRGETALRVRIPGGCIDAASLAVVVHIAKTYGNGSINLTARQGVEIPGISLDQVDAVNRALQPVIDNLGINQSEPNTGYPASGTRNISACVGSRLCPYACFDTTAFAQQMEKEIFPNNIHVKIAFSGCPNDCLKVRMNDFGIMGMSDVQFDGTRCIGCGACIQVCRRKAVSALQAVQGKPAIDRKSCIGCGECVLACPTLAWTRSPKKYFRLTLMGRSGKKNPRMAIDFIKWVDADSIIQIVKNTYAYADHYMDRTAPGGKEQLGYIIDRTGVEEYLRWAMKDVHLPAKAEVYTPLYWGGIHYQSI